MDLFLRVSADQLRQSWQGALPCLIDVLGSGEYYDIHYAAKEGNMADVKMFIERGLASLH